MLTHHARLLFAPPDDADRYLLEGPRQHFAQLLWVNIQTGPDATSGDLWVGTRSGSQWTTVRHPMPARPGFVLPTQNPELLLLGCDKVIGTYSLPTREWLPLAAIPDTHPRTLINDAELLPDGSGIIFGTKDVQFQEPLGHLYHFTFADHQLTTLAEGQTCSNGKVILGDVLYDIDTPTRSVVAYPLDRKNRRLGPKRLVLDLSHRTDYPDGMIDAGNGSVIIAFYNPHNVNDGEAVRFDLATGSALERWIVPGSPRVTCPLLLTGPAGPELILTTALEGMPAEQRSRLPHAGCVFSATCSHLTPLPMMAII